MGASGMIAPATASLVGCGIFVAAMLHAAVTDLRHRRIRNWLVASLATCWAPMALAAGVPGIEMAAAAGAALLVFTAGFGCFAAGWLGGGDVKLAAAAVLWLGAGQALAFVLLTSVLGAALTGLFLLTRLVGALARQPRWVGEESGQAALPSSTPEAKAAVDRQVPYGPALAGAGLALLQGSPFAVAI